MFEVILLSDAEKSFRKLDKTNQRRIAEKIDWLAEHADLMVHHFLTSLPEDLKGLCRLRVGEYRIVYWVYETRKLIKIFIIEHRSKKYRSIRK